MRRVAEKPSAAVDQADGVLSTTVTQQPSDRAVGIRSCGARARRRQPMVRRHLKSCCTRQAPSVFTTASRILMRRRSGRSRSARSRVPASATPVASDRELIATEPHDVDGMPCARAVRVPHVARWVTVQMGLSSSDGSTQHQRAHGAAGQGGEWSANGRSSGSKRGRRVSATPAYGQKRSPRTTQASAAARAPQVLISTRDASGRSGAIAWRRSGPS